MQHIKLLTPMSEFDYLLVERDAEWFHDEKGMGNFLEGDEALFCLSETRDEWQSLEDLQLTLFVKVHKDTEPVEWYFGLIHEMFHSVPMYEWESIIPDENLPEVRLECNQLREITARHSGR